MWVKVCGVRDRKTADALVALNVDAIGLNFYASSPRCIDVETARLISDSLSGRVARVGLFVNHSISKIEEIAAACPLDYWQLHGDETPAFLAELKQRNPQAKLIRACRVSQSDLSEIRDYLVECRRLNFNLAACLVDAQAPGVYGGSGQVAPWETLARDYDRATWPPLILAGGLKPENVAQAIAAVEPWGVDVASGVESSPGVKDLRLVEEFVNAARRIK